MGSQAEQDYLKVIYALSRNGPATTGAIAQRLGVSQPSATNMVKRLARQGLVTYAPYRAVTLTPEGRTVASAVVRRHRILELYLESVLGIGRERIHEEAERLEHAVSDEVEARLDELLGFPTVDPHGELIPQPKERPEPAAPRRRRQHG